MNKAEHDAWVVLEKALSASIQKPLSLEEALVVLDEAETWIEGTRDALREDIRRRGQADD